MMDDIVVKSYKEQIKQSVLKSEAVKKAGFDIIISELKRRGVQTEQIVSFFDKIKNSTKKEELDQLTIDELNLIIDDINIQVTKSLISPVEVADILVQKSRLIAQNESPNGKILDSDPYIKVGVNLASEVNKHGIADGLSVCVKNYCIQKLYQANYREQLILKEKELGIEIEDQKFSVNKSRKKINLRKNQTMNDIFKREIEDDHMITFQDAKDRYLKALGIKVSRLNEYK